LLIGVTSFFRDPGAWTELRETVIPARLAEHPAGGQLRAWAAGCSTGEEAYSLAMVFREALEQVAPSQPLSLQVFATDLDADAIHRARQGLYPENIRADVSSERLGRFFLKEDSGHYRIGKEIREMVIFAPHNLIQDPPFTKIDLLICRNLLIYLTADMQRKLLALFHYSLNPGGVLFLGSAETVSGPPELFTTLNGQWRFYQRATPGTVVPLLPYAITRTPESAHGAPDLDVAPPPPLSRSALVDQLVLQRFAPAAVLTTPQGDILYISGRTGKYLEPAAGQVNWNLFAMAREGLGDALLILCQQARRQPAGEPIIQRGLRVRTNGDFQTLDLSVQALHEPEALRGMLLVVFTDVKAPAKRRRKAGGPATADRASEPLVQEAQQLREALQITREEMQTSQEELKSANEELQSTNEELQSTNEELTTSKEEMQSLNEELQTVNTELQAKVDDLSRVNDDMRNLLDNTEIATLFLDERLRVRRFTLQAATLIRLIPSDVGRPVTDIASDVLYPTLATDVAEVLRTLVFVEKAIAVPDGRWFNVRIMPYRTRDNRIDGVVVTLMDVTRANTLEQELRQVREELDRWRTDHAAGAGPATENGGASATGGDPSRDSPP
jgi:two-component system CheB/CheR fusion protein